MNIVFLDGHTLHATAENIKTLEACGNLTIYERTDASQIIERSYEAEALIVNKTVLNADTLAMLPKLKLVCVAGTGYDKVDVKVARELGITVCNCANYSTRAVAQMALSLILEAADHVGYYTQENRNGTWCASKDFSYVSRTRLDLEGKRFAVVGFGNIGKTLTDMMRPLGVKLFAVSSKTESELPQDVHKIELEEAFATCDIVSLNCPLNAENKAFVNGELLHKANKNLILVNTARGGLINEYDVATALTNGNLGAYCTDVLTQEPPQPDCPILSAPNAYVTPHIGWMTAQTIDRICQIISDNIKAFANGTPKSVVN